VRLKLSVKLAREERGTPVEVILPWSTFCELTEMLGLDLDAKAETDLQETRRDLESGNQAAFTPLATL
jgi:hypothetical protein